MNKALQCMGLAKKAGRLAVGTKNVLDAVRNKKAVAVIVAADVSANTEKLIRDKTSFYNVPFSKSEDTMTELGDILKTAACACAAFTDDGFASMYKRATEEQRR